jgi:hypothetical protein
VRSAIAVSGLFLGARRSRAMLAALGVAAAAARWAQRITGART